MKGSCKNRQHFHGDAFRRLLVPESLQKHGKLVAAESRYGVGVAHRLERALRDLPEEKIAGRVSERIVHILEVIEIDEQDGETVAVTLCARHRLGGAGFEQAAVRQSRQ